MDKVTLDITQHLNGDMEIPGMYHECQHKIFYQDNKLIR